MKMKIGAILALVLFTGSVQAQTTDEWLRQKKTQKQYLLNQIIALQGYIEVAKKGYDIAQKGLNTIGNIKDGDFNLHRDFFNGMQGVNPTIKHYTKIADIMAMQVDIVRSYQRDYKSLQSGGLLHSNELVYISTVYDRLLQDCVRVTDELMVLTTDAQVEMKDDERLQRIETLYGEMKGNQAFCRQFGGEAKWLAASRKAELNQLKTSRAWNGLK